MILHSVVVALVISTCRCWRIESCVDNPGVVAGDPWRFSKPFSVGKVGGRDCWDLVGSDARVSQDFELSASLIKGVGRVFLFLEYFNDSPRRVTVSSVVGGGGVGLLDGDSTGSGASWSDVVTEINGNSDQIRITAILKKQQRTCVGKRVVVRVQDNKIPQQSDFQNKTCAELQRVITVPQQQPPQQPTRPLCTPSRTTTSETGVQSCSVCPECACVCNCDCGKKCAS